MSEGTDLKCLNCGKRFYEKDKFFELNRSYCKKCGKEIVAPTKNQKVCYECVRKKYRKVKECVVCGQEFVAKSNKTVKCPKCRSVNRNEYYLYRNRILSMNLRKMRESKYENIEK